MVTLHIFVIFLVDYVCSQYVITDNFMLEYHQAIVVMAHKYLYFIRTSFLSVSSSPGTKWRNPPDLSVLASYAPDYTV